MMRPQRMAIDPGRLRHPVSIQAPAIFQDDYGGHDVVWSEIATCMAEIVVLSAQSLERARGDDVEVTHRFVMRYRDNIDTSRRLVVGTRAFEIITIIDPDESRRFLHVTTIERTVT